jgi:hypothetical protein
MDMFKKAGFKNSDERMQMGEMMLSAAGSFNIRGALRINFDSRFRDSGRKSRQSRVLQHIIAK